MNSKEKQPNFYSEESCNFNRSLLTSDEYARAISGLVVVCADTMFYSGTRQVVYLAKRKAKPLSNWWMIGGRVRAGILAEQGAANSIKRETGLVIEPSRLQFLAMNRYFFNNRQQEPQDTACDSLCYTYALNISDEELNIANAHLDKDEYEQANNGELALRGFSLNEVEKLDTHPAVEDMARLILE